MLTTTPIRGRSPAPHSTTGDLCPPHNSNRQCRQRQSADLPGSQRQRIDRADAHFRRKAAEVLADDTALRLLAVLYQDGLIELAKFNASEPGIPPAKLTAAGFCESAPTPFSSRNRARALSERSYH